MLVNTGSPLEFIPAQAGAGMTWRLGVVKNFAVFARFAVETL